MANLVPQTLVSEAAVPREQLGTFSRPIAKGKFLFLDGEKFFVKGVTYGAFPPNSRGHQFPEDAEVEKDFRLMRHAGINTILTYTLPERSLLVQAQENGIRVVVNIPWMGYVCFLQEKSYRDQIKREVRDAVRSLGRSEERRVGKECRSRW